MADVKKPKVNAGGGLGLAAGLIGAAAPIVVELIEKLPSEPKHSDEEKTILMPELCSKKFPLTLSEATALLESHGLKALPTEVRLKDACAKYKDCFEFQVIASNKKVNAKLKVGDTVIVQYVTQAVIDESQKIFAEAARQKEEAKQERVIKRSEQMERAKTAVIDMTEKAKNGIGKTIYRDARKKKELGKETPNE